MIKCHGNKKNNSMEKEFINYSEALALKELGFDKTCFGFYNIKGLFAPDYKVTKLQIDNLKLVECCLAPTFSQAFRWFRERHDLTYHIVKKQKDLGKFYGGGIIKGGENYGKSFGSNFDTYEEAELECLKKLISIVNG
jgi:hypothetical protein